MDSKKIEALLEKYWSCETSLEEEQILKEYFLSKDVDEEFSNSSVLFQYYSKEKKKQAEHILSDKDIMNLVQSEGDKRTAGETKKDNQHYLPKFGMLSKIAAVLVIGISITFYVYREQVKEEAVASILQTDTYEDTQKAYEETMKALALISRQLNAGKEQTMKLAKFSEAEEIVQESIVN